MKRTLFIAAALIAFATAASAATLTVVADKATYNPGEVITLTISGSDAGTTTYGVFGRLLYDESLVDSGPTRSQSLVGGGGWGKQTLLFGSGFSESFAQIVSPADSGTNLSDVSNTAFSTVTLIAQALGVVNVTWNTVSGSGFELDFFGLSSAPGTSFSVVPIPEPTTVALLGLGLLGLALGGRRRS